MYNKMKNALLEYEVIINHWPQYSLILENAVADVEGAVIRALEKHYNDILTPLKCGIPERLNMHVQKLTRRQSNSAYCVPSQMHANRFTRLKRILEEMTEEDGEPEVPERMQTLRSQLIDTASNLQEVQEVFTSQIFVSLCRGLWDTLGQVYDRPNIV